MSAFVVWLRLQPKFRDLVSYIQSTPQFPRSWRLYRILKFADLHAPHLRDQLKIAHAAWRHARREQV